MAAGNDVAMRFRYLGRAALCLIQVEDREVVAWADALRQLRDAEAADTWRRNRHRPVLCTRTCAGTPLRTRVRYTHAAEDLPTGYRHGRRAAVVTTHNWLFLRARRPATTRPANPRETVAHAHTRHPPPPRFSYLK